ncbi:hypothetical protein SAMD00019534_097520 [Acytostelium subglobosum LB1]|uniref:hypothetical protein n=1 Tax=Acytostelium subglobosum LB1 TaxID=1410327 RepID=UPI0006448FE0|nr:hypothetical protein SAMD00019534_097520 [Acytostelium subglobosum LB1]GAM26577.1 hypothetical protein SAMD00019534_097520 [Acytostelium subglobosum LB1]|eukprot:XP_012750673.1 hypothetical protein SAMD00019534_097520 [Acytostelium subglobosum LB1]
MSQIKLYFDETNEEHLNRLEFCPSLYRKSDYEVESKDDVDAPSVENAATYDPPYYLYNPHVMVYYSTYKIKRLNLKRNREDVVNPVDGGTVSLDWFDFGNEFAEDTPTILVCHGLTGGSHEPYIQYLAHHAYESKGYRTVVFNNRGCAGNKVTADVGYCGTKIDDMELVIEKIKAKIPNAPLFVVGFSFGSVIMVNYLSAHGHDSPFLAHVSISNPFCLYESQKHLSNSFLGGYIYGQGLATSIKKLFYKFGDRIDKYATKEQIQAAKYTYELDELVTHKMFGYESAKHYYLEASTNKHIPKLNKPILFINAEDDPLYNISTLPFGEIKNNPNTIMAMSKRGSHLGFISYTDWKSWSDRATVEYLSTFL